MTEARDAPNVKMKILFVDQAGGLYGSERGLLTLLGRPRPLDFTAILVAPKAKLWDAAEEFVAAREEMEFGGYGWLKRPDWQLKFLSKFVGVLRHHRPDVVVINFEGNVPLLVLGCKLTRTPVIRMLKREVRLPDSQEAGYKINSLDRRSFIASDGVVCISGAVEKQLREALGVGAEFPSKAIFDPQELIDIPAGDAAARRQSLKLEADALVVGLFARIHPVKGIDTLIKAAPLVVEKLPQVRFLIVGDTDNSAFSLTYLQDLKKLAEELGIDENFIWTGFVSDPMLVMAACDLTALPTRAEGLGRVVIESWSVGRGVVASDTDGPGEIIRLSGGGLLHPVDDHQTLARHLTLLLSDERKRTQVAGLGREWTRQNCDPEIYRARFIESVQGFVTNAIHKG